MLDLKGCNFVASGRTLRVFKKNKEMLRGRNIRGLYQWRVVSGQGKLLLDMSLVVLARRMDKESNSCRKACKASWDMFFYVE